MIRNAHNSLHKLDENEEARLRSKDPRLNAVKSDSANAMTPRRALGNIKNQMTPASGYRKNSATKSAQKSANKKAPTLVFEDENDDDEFAAMCARTYVPPVPWSSDEVPPIETMAPIPNEAEELMHNTTSTLVFEDDEDDFAAMCARTYVPPVPWSLDEVPPIEMMPTIPEEVEELLQTNFILLEKDPDDFVSVPIEGIYNPFVFNLTTSDADM